MRPGTAAGAVFAREVPGAYTKENGTEHEELERVHLARLQHGRSTAHDDPRTSCSMEAHSHGFLSIRAWQPGTVHTHYT